MGEIKLDEVAAKIIVSGLMIGRKLALAEVDYFKQTRPLYVCEKQANALLDLEKIDAALKAIKDMP